MSESIVNVTVEASAVVEPQSKPRSQPQSQFHLVARNPQEMASAQANLAAWFQHKVMLCEAEVNELAAAVAEAKAHKWKHSTLANQHSRAVVRKQFHDKCLSAVQLGFSIIPNIPVDIFVIRTTREKPLPQYTSQEKDNDWSKPWINDEKAQVLPAGEGDYRSPVQRVSTGHTTRVDDKGKTLHRRDIEAVAFDAVEFPIIAAAPVVMSATQEAMLAKVFDQIGVSPQNTRKGDPMIIGQVLGESKGYGTRRTASFLIAWHLDLRTL